MLDGDDKRRAAGGSDDDGSSDGGFVAPKPSFKPAARHQIVDSDEDNDGRAGAGTISAPAAGTAAPASAAAGDEQAAKRPFSMVPSFKHLLGGANFPGLRVDQTCAFQFAVGEPEKVERKSGLISDSFYAYKVTTTTSNPTYLSLSKLPSDVPIKLPEGTVGQFRRFAVKRRYNDFQWLRQALVEEYPGVPVSPVPEKDSKASMDRLFKQDLHRVHEYRQRGLRKFLTSIGSHPILSQSDIVRAFLTLPRDETALNGAPLKNAPGSTARQQTIDSGRPHEGSDVHLMTEDFSHFTLFRDAWTSADKAKQSARGDGSIARKLGSLFSRTKAAPVVDKESTTLDIDLKAEAAYFHEFRDAIGEARDDFAFVREVHKLTEGALREISIGFRYLSFVEKVADPFLSEEFKGQEGAWQKSADLQCDLLEGESKMVMDGFYHYFNWGPCACVRVVVAVLLYTWTCVGTFELVRAFVFVCVSLSVYVFHLYPPPQRTRSSLSWRE